jgi:hypothetical protein
MWTLDDLKKRQATLEAVRLDLGKWDFRSCAPFEMRPIVVVDWSEIFSYITYQPPTEDGSADVFAMHYAGLNYLLFCLPCRLVLLPPYAVEMRHAIELLKTQALAARLTGDLGDKYSSLVGELKRLSNDRKFMAILEGDWSAVEELPDDAWGFLDRLLQESLPSIYLDLQERTATAMRSLKLLLRATELGNRRLQSLSGLKGPGTATLHGRVVVWEDWCTEMDIQRPRLERQNRADALALAYLQAMHQTLYWENVPVFLASRSLAMLHIMENHAGEFEPFPRNDKEFRYLLKSSWRPWEYFAELGYYSKRSMTAAGSALIASEMNLDLVKRIARLDQNIASFRPERFADNARAVAESFYDWATLRGSFDLDGMGNQEHWARIKKPRETQLVDLVRSILAAKDWRAFVERRGALATEMLKDISEILEAIPLEATLSATPEPLVESQPPFTSLTDILVEHLSLADLFRQFLDRSQAVQDSLAGEILELLKGITSLSSAQGSDSANRMLALLDQPAMKEAECQGSRDWLAGIALFFRSLFSESLSYLSAWVEAHSSSAWPALELATRALCAESYRQRDRDYDIGIRLLSEMRSETANAMSDGQRLVWHCFKGQLLINWLEVCKENFEVFPKPGGRSGELDVLLPMVKCMDNALSPSSEIPRPLKVRAANILLYLAGRYIPENARTFTNADRSRKLAWLTDSLGELRTIEKWFRTIAEAHPHASHLHTLGYYNLKVYLVTDEIDREQDAIRYLKYAESCASASRNKALERLLAEQCAWAMRHLGEEQ